MRVPIIMPQLGESIAEATVIRVGVQPGESVAADQEIIEVETNKALMQVTTPCAGEVAEILVEAQQTYPVGAVLGYIEAAPAEAARLGLGGHGDGDASTFLRDVEPGHPAPHEGNGSHHRYNERIPASSPLAKPGEVSRGTGQGGSSGLPVPVMPGGAGFLSPRVRARLAELGLREGDLAGVAGSGAGGRVTVDDLEHFVADLAGGNAQPASAMRLLVGDSMRRSAARPLATVGRPVCLDALMAHRARQPEPKPAFVLYAMRALALALAKDPAPASRMIGRHLLPATSIDIGFAVEVDGGLMVPVLRGLDAIPVRDLQGPFQELVAAARRRQLPPGASGGSVATVTNFGTFGLTWATPIPLPDESLILGLGAARKVPSWSEERGAFVPVTEAELTVTLDHRVLDGGAAGRLMERIVRLLEDPENL